MTMKRTRSTGIMGAVPSPSSSAPRLTAVFALAYFAQATSQLGGLIAQPLAFYLKSLGLGPAAVSEYLAVASFPWMIKPLYGLVSDYLPLFGYRRRSWLMLVNLVAAAGFLWLAGHADAGTLVVALLFTAFGTAAADVIVDALMVEKGRETGLTDRFLGTQWLFFKLAAIMTALLGGWLAQRFEPATALHLAASLTAIAPLALLTAAWLLVDERPAHLDASEAGATTRALLEALRTPELRLAAAFLALWCISPGFGAPLYYHLTDTLGFSQDFIGEMGAATAAGGALGALVFARWLAGKSVRLQANLAITGMIAAVLAYAALIAPGAYATRLALPLSAGVGCLNQIGALTLFAIVARACPPRAAGFTFAAMMSLYNGVEQLSSVIGGHLYERWLDHAFAPLLWIAASAFALCYLLVPSLTRSAPTPPRGSP